MTTEEQKILDTLHHGTVAEVRALRCPKSGGPLHVEYCETKSGARHLRIRGVRSDFIIRASGRAPKPEWVDVLGADFVTVVPSA